MICKDPLETEGLCISGRQPKSLHLARRPAIGPECRLRRSSGQCLRLGLSGAPKSGAVRAAVPRAPPPGQADCLSGTAQIWMGQRSISTRHEPGQSGSSHEVQHLWAGHVTDHDPGQKFDHRADRRTFVAAKGRHRPIKCGFGIGGGPAQRVNRPAFRQGFARAPQQFNLAPHGDRSGEIEHIGICAASWPSESKRVGSKQRFVAAAGGDRGFSLGTSPCRRGPVRIAFLLPPTGPEHDNRH